MTKNFFIRVNQLKIPNANYNEDENVLAYIGASQKQSKSTHLITWTPDAIKDLLKARSEARQDEYLILYKI